jgi:hypothetical protein
VNELACVVAKGRPDLIVMTETWCNSKVIDTFLLIPGYELRPDLIIEKANTGVGREGGLIVYAVTGLQILKLDHVAKLCQMRKFSIYDVELCSVQTAQCRGRIHFRNREVVRLVGKNGLFIGDFNLQDIDWERGVVRRRAVTLLEVAEDNMMKQLVSF